MILGGLQKTSLIDYPGKLSCVLFLSGCNFDCPYCHNSALARGCAAGCTVESAGGVFDFLEERKGFLDAVVVSGGEPTLHEDVEGLCERIKGLGYKVKLDTNGSNPDRVKSLMDKGLVDYVAVDVKTDPFSYSPLIQKGFDAENLLATIRIVMESEADYEFRTTCVKGLVDRGIIEGIAKVIAGAKLYALQRFRNTDVLHPEFFAESDRICSDREMTAFKSAAEVWVERCIVR